VVDLLVARRAAYPIEIKRLRSKVASIGVNWVQIYPADPRTFDNPLHVADAKSKRLKSLVERQARKRGVRDRVLFVQGAVLLTVPSLQVELTDNQHDWVPGPEPSPGAWYLESSRRSKCPRQRQGV